MWKRTAEKTINTVFSAEDNYPQNRKNNFVTFYNDLYIPLNSNTQSFTAFWVRNQKAEIPFTNKIASDISALSAVLSDILQTQDKYTIWG